VLPQAHADNSFNSFAGLRRGDTVKSVKNKYGDTKKEISPPVWEKGEGTVQPETFDLKYLHGAFVVTYDRATSKIVTIKVSLPEGDEASVANWLQVGSSAPLPVLRRSLLAKFAKFGIQDPNLDLLLKPVAQLESRFGEDNLNRYHGGDLEYVPTDYTIVLFEISTLVASPKDEVVTGIEINWSY